VLLRPRGAGRRGQPHRPRRRSGRPGLDPLATAFFASTLDGSRSLAVSATEQLSENLERLQLQAWRALRAVEEDAVCAALA